MAVYLCQYHDAPVRSVPFILMYDAILARRAESGWSLWSIG